MLDGWHGDPFKRGSWVGHRDHALNVVALIARIRELEMTFGALLAEVEERSENADWYADDRAVLEKGVVTP